MGRNMATVTEEQRKEIDDAVLTVIRALSSGLRGRVIGARASEIEEAIIVTRAIDSLPSKKPGHRYVGASLQRLRQADKIMLVRGRWRTSTPTV